LTVEIHLTTALRGLVAYIVENGQGYQVLLNGNLIKDQATAVVAVAHEIGHVLAGTDKHDDRWKRKYKEVRKKLGEAFKIPERILKRKEEYLDTAGGSH
jgi:Zn-dependent peptidase ImmA (M78 family)